MFEFSARNPLIATEGW